MNDLRVDISVSYFPRNMRRKKLFSLITESSFVSIKSSFKRVSSFRKGIYDALGNVWLIRIEVQKDGLPFRFSQSKALFHVIRERMKRLLDKMNLSRSNVLWLIGVNYFDEIFVAFYEQEPSFYSVRKKEYEYRKGKIPLDAIFDFREKLTKSLRRLAEAEELLR